LAGPASERVLASVWELAWAWVLEWVSASVLEWALEWVSE
jgi:hypothetical protein